MFTEAILLGALQGVVEWLPVSSEGVLVLAQTMFAEDTPALSEMIAFSLYLHLGTVLAALVAFRKDIKELIHALMRPRSAPGATWRLLVFLFTTTIISGLLGGAFLLGVAHGEAHITLTAQLITAAIGVLLLGTALVQFRARAKNMRTAGDIRHRDGLLLGIVQGFAAIPGFSRSGLTVSALLLRGFQSEEALRLSFLMSIPIVLAGNIVLNIEAASFSPHALAGLGAAFITGLATITGLISIARRVNFAYFVLAFGLITIGAAFFM